MLYEAADLYCEPAHLQGLRGHSGAAADFIMGKATADKAFIGPAMEPHGAHQSLHSATDAETTGTCIADVLYFLCAAAINSARVLVAVGNKVTATAVDRMTFYALAARDIWTRSCPEDFNAHQHHGQAELTRADDMDIFGALQSWHHQPQYHCDEQLRTTAESQQML